MIEDLNRRAQLFQVALQLPRIPNPLCASIVQVLYPTNISADQLVQLLEKTESVREFHVDLPFYLKSHFEAVVKPTDAGDHLRRLVILAQSQPHVQHGDKILPVSSQFYWIGKLIPTVLEVLFQKPAIRHFGLESSVRPSLPFYNTREEVDALVLALRSLKRS